MNIANDKYKFDEIFLICMIFSKSKQKIVYRGIDGIFKILFFEFCAYNTKFCEKNKYRDTNSNHILISSISSITSSIISSFRIINSSISSISHVILYKIKN